MGKATQGVNYISGSTEGSVGTTRYWGDTSVKLGMNDQAQFLEFAQGDRILGVDLDLGLKNSPFVHVSGLLDRAPNQPSGYNTAGAPTYGDGKLNRTKQFGPDNYWVPSAASFNFMKPNGSQKTTFDSLT